MNELLFFILGLMIGGFIGVFVMCCLQINRINMGYFDDEKYKNNK